MSTLSQLLTLGKSTLKDAGIDNAGHDAWRLLEFLCNIDRGYYFLHETDEVEEHIQVSYCQIIERRKKHVPLQQITGEAYFYGLRLYVNEHVLIPRQDTECLVEEVLKRAPAAARILDMCTGSGCILLALLHELRGSMGIGADISDKALKVAAKNASSLKIAAEFIESDMFEKVSGSYDIIVSNPPYIPTDEIRGLMQEVRDFEPVLALDGMEDGLHFYREIIAHAHQYLRAEGWLCFEIGYNQGESLQCLLADAGYKNIEIVKDLAGLNRVALGQWK